jgi:hypothetical protein
MCNQSLLHACVESSELCERERFIDNEGKPNQVCLFLGHTLRQRDNLKLTDWYRLRHTIKANYQVE